jgi:multidrug transporter EmrE-like cation transporter
MPKGAMVLVSMQAYALLLVGILFGVTGQLLLKSSMAKQPHFRLTQIVGVARNWAVVVGFCCYGASTFLYLHVLGTLDLSVAYPTVSLAYVLVIFMSRLVFNERVSLTRWVAVSIIAVGVAFVHVGSS